MVMDMKKPIMILAAALCCLACEKTNERFGPAPTGLPQSASIRVEMEDGSVIPQDAVMSAWRLDNTRYAFISSESGQKVSFLPASDVEGTPEGVAYVLYPDVEVESLVHGVFNLTLPSVQEAGAPSACICAGHVVNNKASLKRLCGIVSFTVNQGNVASVEISAQTPLSGRAKLSMAATPVLTAEADASVSVSLSGNLESGSTYSLAVFPGTFSGLTVKLRNASGRQIFSSKYSEPVTVSASEPFDLGLVGEPDKPLEPGDRLAIAENYIIEDGSEVENTWEAGASISVFHSGTNDRFSLKNGAGTGGGTFHGTQFSGAADAALSPYDAGASFADGIVTATLSDVQMISPSAEGSIDNPYLIAFAQDDGDLVFKNVCGLLKFTIRGDNIGEVTITDNGGKDIAGKVSVKWNDGEPACSFTEGSSSISVKPAEGEAFKPGTYYAALIPTLFENGLTLTMAPASFNTDAVVKRVFKPASLISKTRGNLPVGRSHIVDLGTIDANLAWNYSSTITMAALRGSKTDSGCYLDFSTGRTFYAIGASAYCSAIDLAMVSNTSNGVAPMSISTVGGYTNATNIGKFGSNYSDADYVSNWAVRLAPRFCYVSADELSDEQYNALSTTGEIKAIYEAHEASAVNSYYTPTPNCVTNANKTGDHKYLVVKTYSSTEGTGYGILKFSGIGGATWYVQFTMKFGLETSNN